MVTFGATFAGVFASFILLLGSRWLYSHHRNKETSKYMLQEIEDEIQENINLLAKLMQSLPKIIDDENAPAFFRPRTSTQALRYAIESGDIRLLSDYRKQLLIRDCLANCEAFDKFVENSDLVFAASFGLQDGFRIVRERSYAIVEGAKTLKDTLEANLKELVGKPKEEEKMVETKGSDSSEERLQRIEQDIKGMQQQLRNSDAASRSLFTLSFGFAVLAVALAIALAYNSIKQEDVDWPLIVLIAILTIGGYAIINWSGGFSIVDLTYGEPREKRRSKRALAVYILCNLGPALAFFGAAIRHWHSTACNALAAAGLLSFVVGIVIWSWRKSPPTPPQQNQSN